MNTFKSTIALIVAALFLNSAPTFANSSQPSMDKVNHILAHLESPSEDMLDAINDKNIVQLQKLDDKLNTLMAQLNDTSIIESLSSDELMHIALLNSWYQLITIELKELDDYPALANAINQFSGQLIVSTHFAYDYQKGVAWMDYLGRELMLLDKYHTSSNTHLNLINTRKTQLQITWQRVQQHIKKDAKGNALVKKVDPVIKLLIAESSPKQAELLAEQELELVDSIEEYFHID